MGWIGLSQLRAASNTMSNASLIRCLLQTRRSHSLPQICKHKIDFARDLQDQLSILALLALSAPFRICKLQILLVTRETGSQISELRDKRATLTPHWYKTSGRPLSRRLYERWRSFVDAE